MIASSFLCAHDDTSELRDLRGRSEQRLIAAAQTGRTDPFGELCERYGNKAFRVVHGMRRNREDAEDAARECFLHAFIHLKVFEGMSQFATWLTRIAINATLMKFHRKHGARGVPMEDPNPSSEPVAQREFRHDAPDPEQSCSLRERKRIVRSAISGPWPQDRNLVELIHLQEHSIRETAQILGIFDRGSKDADVSRENRAASNALAAKCRQLQLCQAN